MKISLKWMYDVKALACVILIIISVISIISGLYLLSPVFESVASSYNETSPILAGLVAHGAIPIVGGLLTAAPIAIFAGVRFKKKKLLQYGSFILAILYIFLAALRVFAIGIVPLTWLTLLAIGLISAVCWVVLE